MLVCSVLTVLTVGASGCSVISEKLTNNIVKTSYWSYYACSLLLHVAHLGVVFSTNLYPTCQVQTTLEQSFSPSISTLTDIHESERSITMVDGKLSSIMFHWYSIHEPHMWVSGLILVVTGELEVPVKALVGSTSTCSGITCSERHREDVYCIHITVYILYIYRNSM